MISFSDFNKSVPERVEFVVSNCNSSFVNALRRIVLTDIETVSFSTEDYENSDLTIIENTSSLNNEFLLHRIGLIPINVPNVEEFDTTKYKFSINSENKTNSPIDITTKDFVITNLETNMTENVDEFFPPNNITKDYILITKLKNNPKGDGEKLHLEGKCSKGIGSQNIRFSPVSCISFINKRDPKRVDMAFNEKIANMKVKPEGDSLKQLATKFDIEEADRHFYIDEEGEPNKFDFVIESVGILKPHRILIGAILRLTQKLKTFMNELDNAMDNRDSKISIRESSATMDGFDIIIDEESHTLGFLLQTYISKLNQDIFVGYMNPHPLEKNIKMRINFNDGNINTIKEAITKTTDYLISNLDTLRKEVLKEFEGKIVFKVQKKK